MSGDLGRRDDAVSGISFAGVLITAAVFYLSVAIPLIAIVAGLHIVDAYFEHRQWAARQLASVRVASESLLVPVYQAVSDLSLMVDVASELVNEPDGLDELTREFVRFSRHRAVYDQIRFINTQGMERIRVQHRNGATSVVPSTQLHSEAGREFFTSTMALERDDVYVSSFDLNGETNRGEHRPRPTIRLVQPVVDPSGTRRGILVFNLDGEKVLEVLVRRDRNSDLRYWLVNPSGCWLFSDDPTHAWSQQHGHCKSIAEVAGLSEALENPAGGLINTPKGQFAFKRVFLGRRNITGTVDNVLSEDPYWIALTVVKSDLLNSNSRARLEVMIVIGAIVLAALVPASFYWGRWRRRAERAKWRERLYAQVIEQSEELVYVTSPDATIVYANPAVTRLTGYQREELIGNKPSIFQSGRQSAMFYASLWKRLRAAKPVQAVFVNRRKDGTVFYESKTISPLLNDRGEATHLVSIGRDITAEQERQEREMRLADQLSLQLSHHFNNLLSPIVNYAEMAADTAEENEQAGIRADIEKVLSGANRIRDVLVKISAMSLSSRLSQGVQVVGRVVRSILKIERSALPDNVHLSLELEDGMDHVGVEFDDLALILSELIGNARDAIEDEGTISLSAGLVTYNGAQACSTCGEPLSGDFIEITVSDTGRGMSASELSHAFDPFFSTKASSRLVGETLGIGLSRVRSRVHAAGGHIKIYSQQGKGTSVHVLCPVREIVAKSGDGDADEHADEDNGSLGVAAS
ncbi:PAS domain S-box protein [Breoghania sp.]|uniref:sensor histidine kinase n=1 Tax=Breoghania sp. TaxID=2065378 RepID=UPI002AAC2117|nr:PAS domain S-box protein [Breoghania sp.]